MKHLKPGIYEVRAEIRTRVEVTEDMKIEERELVIEALCDADLTMGKDLYGWSVIPKK